MTIWVDICDEHNKMPKSPTGTVEDIMQALSMALLLWPIASVADPKIKRGYLVKLAAALVEGIMLVEDAAEAEEA